MIRCAGNFQRGFSLAASLLILFAAPLASAAEDCCRRVIAVDGDACCRTTPGCIPCKCPACEFHRATTIVASFDTAKQRLMQDDLPCARSGATELPVANHRAEASQHAPPPATSLQICVRLTRLTL
tara:strand:- start:345 stop:722 length:378 start_codon:yes stop_codon:yes gene_type:complete